MGKIVLCSGYEIQSTQLTSIGVNIGDMVANRNISKVQLAPMEPNNEARNFFKQERSKPAMQSYFNNAIANELQPDAVLWSFSKKGDKPAFTILYQRYVKILIQTGLRISTDRNFVEDCVHDLFAEIWKNRLNLSLPQSVKAYLTRSIQRKILRQLKKRRFFSMLKEIDNTDEYRTDFCAERKIIAEQTKAQQQNTLANAMNALTKRQKEVVYLKFYADLSYPEIAGKMEISTDSIYNLVSKAIDNMQEELSKLPYQKYSFM